VSGIFRQFAKWLLTYDLETDRLRRIFAHWSLEAVRLKVLDVGSGYGRNLKLLHDLGCNVVGVEVNPSCIEALRADGYACIRPEELGTGRGEFDVVVMAHIIEHFAPPDLFQMMDTYLDHLRPEGKLVVMTPLLSPYFYDDFDHVKPYHPTGLLMVFGRGAAQVQYRSRNQLELEDIWFRHTHYKPTLVRSIIIGSPARYLFMVLELASVLLFHLSGNRFGRKDGWIGVFRKLDADPNENRRT
jgi:SAM-dependent methyltransferase